ncbi:uncharacterized protein [Diadema setosum]|uniref:uncharacterized protein isoform X1 n=1 Tax=Diadema setosum TaxID=31175 RepID=UPI003B3A4657
MSSTIVRCRTCLRLLDVNRLTISQHMSPCPQRLLASHSQRAMYSNEPKGSKVEDVKKVEDSGQEDEPDVPFKFSSSKAATWTADESFGAQYSRPWWKVAPLSISLCIFMAWVFLRSESDIDRELEKTLHDRLPDLFPQAEQESPTTATQQSQEGEESPNVSPS